MVKAQGETRQICPRGLKACEIVLAIICDNGLLGFGEIALILRGIESLCKRMKFTSFAKQPSGTPAH